MYIFIFPFPKGGLEAILYGNFISKLLMSVMCGCYHRLSHLKANPGWYAFHRHGALAMVRGPGTGYTSGPIISVRAE